MSENVKKALKAIDNYDQSIKYHNDPEGAIKSEPPTAGMDLTPTEVNEIVTEIEGGWAPQEGWKPQGGAPAEL